MAGFMVGCITPFASNAFLGQGPWTVLQMFSWGIIGLVSGYLGGVFKEGMKEYFKSGKYRLILSVYAAICGFVYGVIADLWFAFSFYPLEEKFWIASLLAGLGFNLAHAIGNFVFTWLLGPRFIRILMRFKRRMHIEIIDLDKQYLDNNSLHAESN
jgi:energy-coupling factor transport system substrate-specific component